MGAIGKGYSFIELWGCLYALCYRHVQTLCDVGKPVKEETYQLNDPTVLGPSGVGFRAGKNFPKQFSAITVFIPAGRKTTSTKPV